MMDRLDQIIMSACRNRDNDIQEAHLKKTLVDNSH